MRTVDGKEIFESFKASVSKKEFKKWSKIIFADPTLEEALGDALPRVYVEFAKACATSGCRNTQDILEKMEKVWRGLVELYNKYQEAGIFSIGSEVPVEVVLERDEMRAKFFAQWQDQNRCQYYINTLYCYCDETE